MSKLLNSFDTDSQNAKLKKMSYIHKKNSRGNMSKICIFNIVSKYKLKYLFGNLR